MNSCARSRDERRGVVATPTSQIDDNVEQLDVPPDEYKALAARLFVDFYLIKPLID